MLICTQWSLQHVQHGATTGPSLNVVLPQLLNAELQNLVVVKSTCGALYHDEEYQPMPTTYCFVLCFFVYDSWSLYPWLRRVESNIALGKWVLEYFVHARHHLVCLLGIRVECPPILSTDNGFSTVHTTVQCRIIFTSFYFSQGHDSARYFVKSVLKGMSINRHVQHLSLGPYYEGMYHSLSTSVVVTINSKHRKFTIWLCSTMSLHGRRSTILIGPISLSRSLHTVLCSDRSCFSSYYYYVQVHNNTIELVYRIAGNFRGIKFLRMAYFLKFADNIFADP